MHRNVFCIYIHMWGSKDNLQESLISVSMLCVRVHLKSSGLVASTCTCWVPSLGPMKLLSYWQLLLSPWFRNHFRWLSQSMAQIPGLMTWKSCPSACLQFASSVCLLLKNSTFLVFFVIVFWLVWNFASWTPSTLTFLSSQESVRPLPLETYPLKKEEEEKKTQI